MRMFIGSDVHGSEANLIRFFTRVDASLADDKDTKVILLGDIYNHGPRNPFPEGYAPMRVAKLLNDAMSFITVIKGNCDSEVDQMVLPFAISPDYAAVYADGVNIYLSHGHREVPPLGENDVYITGHTHVPLCESVTADGGKYLHLNPGSVSLPKENSAHGYILFDCGTFYFKTLDGKVFKEVKI